MARMSYDYDSDGGAARGGSVLRLAVLVIVIGAVTAGAIWWIVPHGSAVPDAGKTSDVSAPAAEEVPVSGPRRSGDPAAVSGTSALPAESSAASPAAADLPLPAPAESGDPGKAAGGNADPASSSAAAAPTPADRPPVKGIPWAGDPPEAPAPKPDAAELAEKAATAANALIFDSGKGAGVIFHTAKAGDALGRIARSNHTTTAAVMRLNRLKSPAIRIGQKLAVLPGPWRIEVVKSQKKLRLYRSLGEGRGEELFFAFDIGIGRRNSTPTGDFVIYNHVSRPEWTAPDGTVYPYGDPGNPLGDYFLRLAPAKTPGKPLGYGIHGSRDGEGVGLSISSGCVRMRNREIGLVFLVLPNGTPVSIKD